MSHQFDIPEAKISWKQPATASSQIHNSGGIRSPASRPIRNSDGYSGTASQAPISEWEGGTRTAGADNPFDALGEFVSIDRPVFLALIQFLQLMNPSLFTELNPLSRIGSIDPDIPDISDDALMTVNDFISTVWGSQTKLMIPIVILVDTHPSIKRGVHSPVPLLNVRTKTVVASRSVPVEDEITKVKSNYKYQDTKECIDAGLDLIRMLLLGRLVTTPPKSSLRRAEDSWGEGQTPRPRGRSHSRSQANRPAVTRSSSLNNASHHAPQSGIFRRLGKVLGM